MTASIAKCASLPLPRAAAPHSYVRSYELVLTVTVESVAPQAWDDERELIAARIAADGLTHWPANSVVEVRTATSVDVPADHQQGSAS